MKLIGFSALHNDLYLMKHRNFKRRNTASSASVGQGVGIIKLKVK